MPTASEKSAVPPSQTSRVWLRYSNAPASGAATQGLTISADTPPIAQTPATRPAGSLCDAVAMRDASADGSCRL